MACEGLVRLGKLKQSPVRKLVGAVSAGVFDGTPVVDLNYAEDKAVTVDFNLVATEDDEFVEMQGSGEEATFSDAELKAMLELGRKGIRRLIAAQRAVFEQASLAAELRQLPTSA
jgi:ribonuclease PH